MSVPDIVFLVILGLLTLRGFLTGFSGELLSIATLALALVAAVFLFDNVASYFRSRYLPVALLPELLGFLAVFLAVSVAGKLLQKIVKDIVERIDFLGLDKTLGLILGLAEGFALVVLILFLLRVQPFFDTSKIFDTSFIARILLPVIGAFHV
jgi:membrane protein required for colicin V production